MRDFRTEPGHEESDYGVEQRAHQSEGDNRCDDLIRIGLPAETGGVQASALASDHSSPEEPADDRAKAESRRDPSSRAVGGTHQRRAKHPEKKCGGDDEEKSKGHGRDRQAASR